MVLFVVFFVLQSLSVTFMKLAFLSTLSSKAEGRLLNALMFFQWWTWPVVPLSLSSFLYVTESHAQTNTAKNTLLKTWLTEAQVVAQESLHQWSYCDSQKHMLADILDGLPGMPHDTSYLAAKGHKQYEYSTKALTQITRERTVNIEYMAEAKVDSGRELDTLIENLDSNMHCTGPDSKPRPLLAKPNNELTGTDKVKVD